MASTGLVLARLKDRRHIVARGLILGIFTPRFRFYYPFLFSIWIRGYVDTWIRGIRIYPHSDGPWRARIGGPQGTCSSPGMSETLRLTRVRCGHATCREETATHTDALGRPGNCIASAARQRGALVIAQAHGVKK